MICVLELICKSVSHEKVNSGFLKEIRLSFPNEEINFFGEKNHINALKKMLVIENVHIENIKYFELKFFMGEVFSMYILLWQLANKGHKNLLFLSFSPKLLLALKILKKFNKFSKFKFMFVLHGGFEEISRGLNRRSSIDLPRNYIPKEDSLNFLDKIKKSTPKRTAIKACQILKSKLFLFLKLNKLTATLSYKRVMQLWHTDDYRYIALSPHIIINAEKFIDTKFLNISSISMPTFFKRSRELINNEYVKFAVFGYGDSLVLNNIAHSLSQRRLMSRYEIKIIGMDDRGTKNFPNIKASSGGKLIDRSEMEALAGDVDFFLILYDQSRYQLSCSASIMEALSMIKPIIHFDNECVNQFNDPNRPIGFKCKSYEDYIDVLTEIIENYGAYHLKIQEFKRNIEAIREDHSIENNAIKLRKYLSWVDE